MKATRLETPQNFQKEFLICWLNNPGMRKYLINDDLFDDINNESKAYFLGLLYADGCVQQNGPHAWTVSIGLHKRDEHIVWKLKEALRYSGPLYRYPYRTILRVSSEHIALSLVKHGCVPKKSLVLKFPETVPRTLWWHFIRGYFDGDGTLTLSGRGARWMLVGTEHFLCGVARFLACNNIHATVLKHTYSKVYMLSVSGNRQIANLLNHLYNDATIWMKRKKEKARELERLRLTLRPIKQSGVKELELDEMIQAYKQGLKICEIEKKFNISNRTMYKILKKHNVPNRRPHANQT